MADFFQNTHSVITQYMVKKLCFCTVFLIFSHIFETRQNDYGAQMSAEKMLQTFFTGLAEEAP